MLTTGKDDQAGLRKEEGSPKVLTTGKDDQAGLRKEEGTLRCNYR